MSRTRGIEGDQDPTQKATRSNTLLTRASTISQTIQVITNKLRFSTSPKLRRSRRKLPYERATSSLQEPYEGEENIKDTPPPIEDDSIETEVFFKQATTTSQLYQVSHSLDDTLPYFDPLLDLQRHSFTPPHSLNITPPSPFDVGFGRQTYTPPLPLATTTTLEAVPGTSRGITHTAINPAEITGATEELQESEGTKETDRHTEEQNSPVDLIDLCTESTPSRIVTVDLWEQESPVHDWNAKDIIITEDDRDTPFTMAQNTLIIEDSDDAHSDCSIGSEEGITGLSTPPLTPSRVAQQNSPEKRRGFGNPPWAADQNTGHSDVELPQPKATSSPKSSSPKVKKKDSSRMESQTQVKGKTHNYDTTINMKHVNQTPNVNAVPEIADEMTLQGMLLDRQAALPKLIRTMQRYLKLEQPTLEVVLMYYRATHNEFPLLELTRESRDLLLDTLERVFTGFTGMPPQTLLLHSDLSILIYTYTLSEIAELYPMVARHMQPLYQTMFPKVEMHEGKPCRYNDVHEIIATFYPISLQEQSRHTFPSMTPDDVHHALMRPTFELNVRTVHDVLDRMVTTPEMVRDKRKSTSQANDSDTNTYAANGKKVTILDSDIDTNTGRTGQDYSTVDRLHNLTYTCNQPSNYYRDTYVPNQSDSLTMQDPYDKEGVEEKVKTKCKVEVKDESNEKKQESEERCRFNKATDYFYDVNWRHDSSGKKAHSHKVPNKYSYYNFRPPRQEYVVYPATQVPPPIDFADQRTHEFQTTVPGTSGQVDLHAPPVPTGNTSNNATLAGAHHNVQRSLSRSFNLNDRGPNNNTTPQLTPNFPDLTGRNNNVTPVNTGVTGIGGLAPQATSTPNQNAAIDNTHSNLQPSDPMYNLLNRLIEVQERQTNSIVETQFRDKKFDGTKPELAHIHLTNFKSHWARLKARKMVQDDQYHKHFHDTLSGSAYEWFDKRKQDLITNRQIQDAFLARYNKWGENRQTCLDEWQSLKYPWAIPMDDFLEDLMNLAYIVEVTEEHMIMTFKSSMPDEIKVHLVSCDSLSECAKTAENIINLFKRQNKIPVDAHQPDKDKSSSQSKSNTDKSGNKKQEQKKNRVDLHYENEELQ